MKRIALFLIRAYQILISPLMSKSCRFQPTCSEYARLCFEKYAPGKAFVKTIKRLSRCTPFSKGGIDEP